MRASHCGLDWAKSTDPSQEKWGCLQNGLGWIPKCPAAKWKRLPRLLELWQGTVKPFVTLYYQFDGAFEPHFDPVLRFCYLNLRSWFPCPNRSSRFWSRSQQNKGEWSIPSGKHKYRADRESIGLKIEHFFAKIRPISLATQGFPNRGLLLVVNPNRSAWLS